MSKYFHGVSYSFPCSAWKRVNFMRHHQRKSVREAHPTGNVIGGEFYAPPAAEIGAQSAPYG
jgi:hypothetical protein